VLSNKENKQDRAIELLEHIQIAHTKTNATILMISHQLEHTVFLSDTVIPFKQRPVSVVHSQLMKITCPYPRPRPMRWMYEKSFRDEVDKIRLVMGGVQ
jgi:ABC-type nitrate/sulfonate/bicarbonate transport system ATPase subunit